MPHHLLDKEALEWLSRFKDLQLTDAQRRALVFAYELGAITNQDYRQLNGTDTLTASAGLRGLRDNGLLVQKGKSNGTYYVLGPRIVEVTPHISSPDKERASLISGISEETSSGNKELTPGINLVDKGLTPHTSSLYEGLDALPEGLPCLPEELRKDLCSLAERSQKTDIKGIIKRLCALGPLQLSQLAKLLRRDPRYLRDYYLSKMIRSKELVYFHPDQPVHPQQAYKTPNGGQK